MVPGAARLREPSRSLASLVALAVAALALVAVLIGLGTWQVYRLAWKRDLIARVEARVHAAPTPPPGPGAWPGVTAASDDYRHVRVTGTFLDDADTLVQAVTDYGPGSWVLTPFRTTRGSIVLINRGFVPSDLGDRQKRAADRVTGETTVTGLLRMSEPGGAFLRHNDPGGDRWFSRDVAAIARRRGLTDVAPYFIDADGQFQAGRYPIPGLTVVTFPNNHLVYAFTWYTLAVMLTGAAIGVGRQEWRRRREPDASSPS